METAPTDVYKFDELEPAAKDRAISRIRESDGYLDYGWHEYAIDDAKAIGAIIGFTIDTVSFSGFCYQGDGASFTGEYRYSPGWREKLRAYAPTESRVYAIGERLAAAQRRQFYGLTARIVARGRYCHSGTMSGDAWTADGREASADDSRELIECAKALADWIYSRLESEYEYLMSDDSIAETIRANDYEFTADGEMI